ncbi:MAG TPA: glycosyltransferase [Thermoguttaceae bacterium]|nr:glycosyltransferase [Thermoguttaceae bacterium]
MISTHGYVSAAPEFGKPDTGGQVVYVLELSKCLARMGYRVDVLTRRFEDQPAREEVSDRVRVLRFPCGGKGFIPKETLCDSIPEWVSHVRRYLTAKNLRCAFINSHYWDGGLAGQALANAIGIPHIHTPHSIGAWKRDSMDGDPEELERKYNFRHRIREEKVVYDECDVLVATTPQQRDILLDGDYDVPLKKICVIPPGYDDTRFFPVSLATRQALKQEIGIEGPIVLALGRMAKNKGYDLLLRAMPTVFSRVDDARLLLAVGSTEPNDDEVRQIEQLKHLATELGIRDRVLFRDYVPDELLGDYYRAADVFALSSRYEPFGMTAVEAMACGTPTVVTTEGGLWEQVTWGLESLYADPFDPESFGHAMATVLMRPRVRDQLAKFGSQKARLHFTWTGVAQQLLRVLQSVQLPPTEDHRAEGADHPTPSASRLEAEEEPWKVLAY